VGKTVRTTLITILTAGTGAGVVQQKFFTLEDMHCKLNSVTVAGLLLMHGLMNSTETTLFVCETCIGA